MVFLQWVNLGEDFRRDDATEPARIADLIVRGLIVDRAGTWHIALSCIVLALGVFLSVRVRVMIQAIILGALVPALLFLDGWIFHEWLLLTNLVYPAFTAAVSATVLPLVRVGLEKP